MRFSVDLSSPGVRLEVDTDKMPFGEDALAFERAMLLAAARILRQSVRDTAANPDKVDPAGSNAQVLRQRGLAKAIEAEVRRHWEVRGQ